jgi:hypothetical protein
MVNGLTAFMDQVILFSSIKVTAELFQKAKPALMIKQY